MSCAVSIRGVSVRFGAVEALRDVTLELAPGERVAVVGPSGSGKSTLLQLIIGAVRPAAGEVTTAGVALDSASAAAIRDLRSRIGFIHQHLGLAPNLRVIQNVASGRLGRLGFMASLRHVLFPPKQIRAEIAAVLDRVGIAEKIHLRADSLSGGQQQRVALARALWQNPQALLADEPVSSLDPARARDVLGLLARMSDEEGLTLCVSLHQFDLAREFFPRLVGLRGGRIIFDRSSRDVTDADGRALYALTRSELLEDA